MIMEKNENKKKKKAETTDQDITRYVFLASSSTLLIIMLNTIESLMISMLTAIGMIFVYKKLNKKLKEEERKATVSID